MFADEFGFTPREFDEMYLDEIEFFMIVLQERSKQQKQKMDSHNKNRKMKKVF